jgi:hypothetical protein
MMALLVGSLGLCLSARPCSMRSRQSSSQVAVPHSSLWTSEMWCRVELTDWMSPRCIIYGTLQRAAVWSRNHLPRQFTALPRSEEHTNPICGGSPSTCSWPSPGGPLNAACLITARRPHGTLRHRGRRLDTAITEAEFGPTYDMHRGALDLVFPHHEAEIAQMESISACGLHSTMKSRGGLPHGPPNLHTFVQTSTPERVSITLRHALDRRACDADGAEL